jgi:hypothetical protein
MTNEMWNRLAAAAGMISVVFFVIAGLVYGNPPNLDAEPGAIAEFFVDNRDQVLWAVFIQGLGVLAMVWFFAALVVAIREAGQAQLAAAAALFFVVALALGSIASLTRASLAFTLAEGADAGIVGAFYEVAALMDTSQNVVSAGSYAAVAVAVLRTRLLPAWWGWASAIAALFAVVSATAWNTDGFWSPDGAGYLNFVVYVVWIGVTSLLLTLKTREGTA